MWNRLLPLLLPILLLACASVTRTGIIDGDVYTDSQYQTKFEKNANWDFYVPPEGKVDINPWRFSLYRSEVGHTAEQLQIKPVYGPRDSITGPHHHQYERSSTKAQVSSAEAHYFIHATELDVQAFRDSLLAEWEDYKLVGNIQLGYLGTGYHLTHAEEPFGDIYFTVHEDNAYVVEFFAWESNYHRQCREELEKMLTVMAH